jgi:hypothetical protein
MKSRFILALLIAVAALLVLLVQTASKRTATATRPSTASGNGANSTGADAPQIQNGSPLGNGSRLETPKERRERMMSNKANRDDFRLSEQEVYLYVQANGSNALSLVAAFESTRDKDYLKAAAEKFPNDPFVQAKALMWLDMPDDERAKWLDAFKNSSPTNAFPNLLAAQAAIKRGDMPTVLAEIAAMKDKGYDEFFQESAQGLEDAYLSAGRSAAEAKTLGSSEITLPHMVALKEMGKQLLERAQSAAAEGDTKTQQEILMANWQIGEKLRVTTDKLPIITELVGIAMENATLRAWPAGVEFAGGSTADALTSNANVRKQLQSAAPIVEKWFPTAPDDEIVNYMDTLKTAGERQAIAWLREQHPELAQISPPKN